MLCEGHPLVTVRAETATADELSEELGWQRLDESTVEGGFSEEVVLEADCRDESYSAEPDERIELIRREDGESCTIALYVDGTEAREFTVSGATDLIVVVSSDGELFFTEDAA